MGLSVLVVEDDAYFRGLVTRILEEWGHEAVEAGSVAEALAEVSERRPDIVLTDIGLPDGDGLELAERLLAMSSDLRVIVISSDSGAGNYQAAERAGAIGFLPKDELFSEMRGLIESPEGPCL
jgi:CheY-like chemotaxis protein